VPVYVYRRDDGSIFEIEQRITADALVSCPTSGQKVERVLQGVHPALQGLRLLLDGPPQAEVRVLFGALGEPAFCGLFASPPTPRPAGGGVGHKLPL